MATVRRSDPALWERVKRQVTAGDKGGQPGQWSARKAQLAVQDYKRRGGAYEGEKPQDTHLQQWERQDWGTKSGRRSRDSGERYLPRRARAAMSDQEYARTSAKKRADTKAGRQFSRQPKDVAEKATRARLETLKRPELLERARKRRIPGASRMRKAELIAALRGH